MGGAQRVIVVGNIMTEKKKGGKTSRVSEAGNDSSALKHLFEISATESQEERGRVDGRRKQTTREHGFFLRHVD